MTAIKRGGRNTKRIFVLLVLLGIITASAPAVQAAVLWVVPDSSTKYSEVSDDFLLEEIVIKDVYMGLTFSGNVLVLKKAPETDEEVESVYLKFFVEDNSTIEDITIGTAERIQTYNLTHHTIPNPNSNSSAETLTFFGVATDHPVPAGYGVEYLIGDVPYYGGNDIGDPTVDFDTFNPYNASFYVKVPFTINFKTTPAIGFTLYVYAENYLECSEQKCAKTAYSHDGGYTQVPEFTTIAIPVGAILGLLFFFNHRKRKKS